MSDTIADAIAAASIRLGDAATGVLARLGGPLGESTRAIAAELASLPPRTHRLRRAEILAASRAAVPVGVRVLDPSWLEAGLAALPARARTAVANGGGDATDVWLARWATAELPPVAVSPRSGTLAQRLALPSRDLVAWLANVGADQLAYALGEALAASRTSIAAALARIARPPRRGNLGPERAALARCKGLSLDDEVDALTRIACRALAPHLANDPALVLVLTRRFPYERGRSLERELVENVATPLDHAPSLDALLAP